MRISSSMIFDQGVRGMGQRQETLYKLQEQLSTNKRVNRPSDDPVAAAQIQSLTQSRSRTDSFLLNGKAASSALAVSESQIDSAVNTLQDVMQLAVQAGNSGLGDQERLMIATQVEASYKQLLSIANSDDGNGVYLYAGTRGTTTPFVEVSPGVVVYVGDQGQREMQIDASRRLPISDNGSDIFMNVRNGNGTFVTSANAANTGSGWIDPGSVANPALLTRNNYEISFTAAAGVTQYSVRNTTTNTVVVPPTQYQAGSGINVDGMAFTISGQPNNGDRFAIAPSTSQSLFTTINEFVQSLRTPSSNDAGAQADAQTTRLATMVNLQNGLRNVLRVQTDIGSRMKEIDAGAEANEGLKVQYTSSISRLEDLDFTKAYSDFVQAQITLQAAQQSFQKVQGLSLFNYL